MVLIRTVGREPHQVEMGLNFSVTEPARLVRGGLTHTEELGGLETAETVEAALSTELPLLLDSTATAGLPHPEPEGLPGPSLITPHSQAVG